MWGFTVHLPLQLNACVQLNGNRKACALCYCSAWALMEYLFPDYPVVF